MINSTEILSAINSRIQEIAHGAKVLLFGSRATGDATEESDWDILILTQQQVDSILKKNIHAALFPFSVKIGAFINALTIQENEWFYNPSYYSLRQATKDTLLQV